jgi:hypothetical protein
MTPAPTELNAAVDDHSTPAPAYRPRNQSLSLTDEGKLLFRVPPTLRGSGVGRLIPGETLTEFYQLHHGIYRCVGNQSKVKFALKTECRPAQKWHGQQGWTEVAVHHLSRLIFGDAANTVPPAVGMVVSLTQAQRAVVHKDGCGADLGTKVGPVHDWTTKLATVGSTRIVRGPKPLVGVALEWRQAHDDGALDNVIKKLDLGKYWKAASLEHRLLPRTRRDLEYVRQISDVFVLDYLVANEDREEKNWFTVPIAHAATSAPTTSPATDDNNAYDETTTTTKAAATKKAKKSKATSAATVEDGSAAATVQGVNAEVRFVAMDNGWAFIGRGYKTGICDEDRKNLECPPLLRHLSGSSICRAKLPDSRPLIAANCRFRRSTIARIRELRANDDTMWQPLRREWLDILSKDPLIVWLLEQYGTEATVKFESHSDRLGTQFSMALARFVQGCPKPSWVPATAEWHQPGNYLTHQDTPRFKVTAALLEWLAVGVEGRMHALLVHVDKCVASYGEGTVYMEHGVQGSFGGEGKATKAAGGVAA